MSADKSWIGVDLDGTLARYDTFTHHMNIGKPIRTMVERVKGWLAEGKKVKIMTARANATCYYDEDANNSNARINEALRVRDEAVIAIRAWCIQHIGADLEVTCVKDMHMVELWDDRAVEVTPNTGVACLACAAKRTPPTPITTLSEHCE